MGCVIVQTISGKYPPRIFHHLIRLYSPLPIRGDGLAVIPGFPGHLRDRITGIRERAHGCIAFLLTHNPRRWRGLGIHRGLNGRSGEAVYMAK
jgi:hypothetical protein